MDKYAQWVLASGERPESWDMASEMGVGRPTDPPVAGGLADTPEPYDRRSPFRWAAGLERFNYFSFFHYDWKMSMPGRGRCYPRINPMAAAEEEANLYRYHGLGHSRVPYETWEEEIDLPHNDFGRCQYCTGHAGYTCHACQAEMSRVEAPGDPDIPF